MEWGFIVDITEVYRGHLSYEEFKILWLKGSNYFLNSCIYVIRYNKVISKKNIHTWERQVVLGSRYSSITLYL